MIFIGDVIGFTVEELNAGTVEYFQTATGGRLYIEFRRDGETFRVVPVVRTPSDSDKFAGLVYNEACGYFEILYPKREPADPELTEVTGQFIFS